MSIKRMTDVWEKSTHTSSDLLLLLALADNANDEGYCWPGIDKLCKKTRLSESTVIRRTRAIEKSGELVVKRSRRHGNKYLVVTGFTPEQIEALINQYFGEKFLTVKLQDTPNLQNDSSELASFDRSELAPVTDDPSLTVKEPSKDSGAEPAPDAPRYAVGQRVAFPVDNAVGTVRERVNQDGAWDYLVMWDDGVHPEWHPESALASAPAPDEPPPADPPAPRPAWSMGQRVQAVRWVKTDREAKMPPGVVGTVVLREPDNHYVVAFEIAGEKYMTIPAPGEYFALPDSPSDDDPPDPPTPPTPKRGRASKTKPADHKPRADDPLFDLIAQRSFGIDPRGPDVKPLGGRIGVLKGIAVGKAYDVVKLQAAYDWYKKHRKGCTSPRGAPAFTNMLNDYDAAHKPALQLAEEPELDAPHAYLKRIREERDRVREAAFLSAS